MDSRDEKNPDHEAGLGCVSRDETLSLSGNSRDPFRSCAETLRVCTLLKKKCFIILRTCHSVKRQLDKDKTPLLQSAPEKLQGRV
jgi:hypothetical protein